MKPYMTKTYLQFQTEKEVEELLDATPAEIDLQNDLARIRTVFAFLGKILRKNQMNSLVGCYLNLENLNYVLALSLTVLKNLQNYNIHSFLLFPVEQD